MAASVRPSMFSFALSRILDSWTALQLAVQQSFGGPESAEKARWMIHAIETWFLENQGLETYEVEDFLERVLNSEFNLILEDNSVQEIARLICLYYRLCQEKTAQEIQQLLQSLPRPAVQGCLSGGEPLEFDTADVMVPDSALSYQPPPRFQQNQTYLNSAQSSSSRGNADSMETDEQPQEAEDGWQVIRRGKKR
ncbi:hypothetical protein RRG08_027414 [Elysia crispata]|uniref:Pre-rRNA-processing protein TSR2 homolog n=1 Tax=Elysia crispata TaxID=231223 RepID=A0AAE0YGT7_9GAST|nr:hypothetical protein RRG08_027414 [Elysia crispata]